MPEPRSLYDILGVARDVDIETLRKAYRKLARQNHPDLNPDDKAAEERFKEISHAWEVLSDEGRRRDYDEFGAVSLESGFDADEARKAREAFGARFGATGPAWQGGGDEFHFGGIDDLLGRMFQQGGNRGPGMKLRGADLEAGLELDFLEAVRGGEKRLTLSRPTADGGFATDSVRVRIPPGVASNGRLRIPGKGGPGAGGGPAGDLWVTLQVRPHRIFQRDGRNLTLELPISVREAIEGARVEVPTLDGRATLTIPPGTDSGTRLRMRGKGVPAAGGGTPGDLLVRVQIRVPKDLDAEGEAALETLRRLIYLGVEERQFLEPLRREGLFEADELEPAQAEDLRLAAVLMQDLGVNAAGVDVALHLRRRLLALERRAHALADALEASRGSD
jgi:DnaJ-class molecular chaperone